MKNKEENLKDIDGFEGLYQISDLGNVKSVARVVHNRKYGLMKIKERILKPGLSGVKGRQYYQVSLSREGEMHRRKVHQLVAFQFISKDLSLQVDHIDNDKLNNRADNLQRLSCRDNCIKAFDLKDKKFMTGVSKTKDGRHFKSIIHYKGELFILGYFKTELEAGEKYLNAKLVIDEIYSHHVKVTIMQLGELSK